MKLPEQRLEVLRQLSSSSVSWIHGDENTDSVNNGNLHPLEDESALAISDGVLH